MHIFYSILLPSHPFVSQQHPSALVSKLIWGLQSPGLGTAAPLSSFPSWGNGHSLTPISEKTRKAGLILAVRRSKLRPNGTKPPSVALQRTPTPTVLPCPPARDPQLTCLCGYTLMWHLMHSCPMLAQEFPLIHFLLHLGHLYSPKQRFLPWYGVRPSPLGRA